MGWKEDGAGICARGWEEGRCMGRDTAEAVVSYGSRKATGKDMGRGRVNGGVEKMVRDGKTARAFGLGSGSGFDSSWESELHCAFDYESKRVR